MSVSNESESRDSPSSARKRKHWEGEESGRRARPFKHRSSRACQSCRTRKVRCDVLANGSPCTNCRLDDEKCILAASRRGRPSNAHGNSITAVPQRPSPPAAATTMKDSTRNGTTGDSWMGHEEILSQIVATGGGHVPVCVTFDEDLDTEASNDQRVADETSRPGTDRAPSDAYDGLLTPETATNTSKHHHHQSLSGKAPILPAFITPLSGRILSEDLEFLTRKGAFILPEPELRVEILRGYLFSVHPFMPMLNFRSFTHAVLNDRGDSQVSLLLFQAVMFAGLHSLQSHTIHRLGFESTKQAREVFFHRVRLLYEFDVEPDSAAILQSLILMSSYYSKGNERRHTWHFTGLAYDVARSMGLHREPTTRRYASDKVRRFRRRLWWSLYIRDRMIALGTRRPMRIRDEDFNVTMLTLEDFDLEPLDEFSQGQPLLPSADENTSTALMCIQLARLGIIIGRVASSQYTTLATSDIPHTMMVVSRCGEGRTEELESCDRELNEWWQALGANVGKAGSPTSHDDPPHICSEVHWAMLNMTYLTVVNVLHRAQALQSLPDAAESPSMQRLSRTKLKDAARSLTRLSQTLLRHDWVRFLGLIGVTALVAACLSHMLDVHSGDEDIRDASTFRLYQSLQVLQSLRGIYASADAAVDFLASVTRKAGISVPTQGTAPDFLTASSAEALVKLSESGRQSDAAWKDVDSPATRSILLNEQYRISPRTGWQINGSSQGLPRTCRDSQPHAVPDRDRHVLSTNSVMQPSPLPFPTSMNTPVSTYGQASDMTRDVSAPVQQMPQFMDSMSSRGLTNSVAPSAGFFDWNSSGIDTSAIMDPTLTAFNYDFYADAFGFLDDNFMGLNK